MILSSNMIDDSNDSINFPHELLLTDKQVSSIPKAFANYSSANMKLSKTQLSKIVQSGRFLGRLLGPLLKIGLPLIKNVFNSLAKDILISLGLTAAISAADAGTYKKIFKLGVTNFQHWRNSNKEMDDIIKINLE